MTDTSKLKAEAAAISKQSPAIRAFAIDSAANTVQQAQQIADLEKRVAALEHPTPPVNLKVTVGGDTHVGGKLVAQIVTA